MAHRNTQNEEISPKEARKAEERTALRAPIVYEVVRRQGEEELGRPLGSLWWSGIAAGLALFMSVATEGLLHHYLPDTSWRPIVENFGYCLGFLVVILGRIQLFTENTITTVLPVLAEFSRSHVYRMMRLWGIVLFANLIGIFLAALVTTFGGMSAEAHVESMRDISRHLIDKSAWSVLMHGIPAGFAIAAIVWIRPSAEGADFWVIVVLTYFIAIGEFTHVVAGAGEVFLLMLNGELSAVRGVAGIIVPSFFGNVIGGTLLFSLLAYAQVREEM